MLTSTPTDSTASRYASLVNWLPWSVFEINGCRPPASTLRNCIVYYNSNTAFPDYYDDNCDIDCRLDHCCTWPAVAFPDTNGNITAVPEFVDTNGWSNLRLRPYAWCKNAGNNAYAAGPADLDGRPRIISGQVDIGAYEFQGPFNDYLQQYRLPIDGSADFTDPDGDGFNNWQECVTGTVPTNAMSALRMLLAAPGALRPVVSWQSVSNRTYWLERATNLGDWLPFSRLASNILGQAGTTSYTDTNATGSGPFFYRVGVQP
jgi:hypothetical protein